MPPSHPSYFLSLLVSRTPQSAPLSAYRFSGVSGSVTLTGYYVDATGVQTGKSITLTIPQANSATDPVGFASATYLAPPGGEAPIPDDAVGFVGRLSGDVYCATCGGKATETADFKAQFAGYQVVIAEPNRNRFGVA